MLSSRVIFHDTGMMDTEAWNAIAGILSCVDHTRRPHAGSVDDDPFGALNVILFGDMKQSADRPKYERRSRRSIACCVFFRLHEILVRLLAASSDEQGPLYRRALGCAAFRVSRIATESTDHR